MRIISFLKYVRDNIIAVKKPNLTQTIDEALSLGEPDLASGLSNDLYTVRNPKGLLIETFLLRDTDV